MLHHYTTIEALFSIIEHMCLESVFDENGLSHDAWYVTLRATHIGFLNDTTEGEILPSALARCGVDQKKLTHSLLTNGKSYVLSFSRKYDDLNMWRSYSNDGTGVILSFNRTALTEHIQKLYCHNKPLCYAMSVEDCVYNTEDELYSQIFYDEKLKKFQKDGNLLTLSKLLEKFLNYKHPCFLDEAETRVTLIGPLLEKYRIRNNMLVPYQEISFPLTTLECITIGPKQDVDRMQYSIYNLLKIKLGEANIKHLKLAISELPYL